MKVINSISDLKKLIENVKESDKTIGFVPTMGALHKGHLSLIEKAAQENDIVVVSIYINPTQFNNHEDFIKYPRIFEKDIALLENTQHCDILFMPDDKEMYPEPDNRVFNLGYLEDIMEGKYRPGHFQGVVKIVTKFFDIILPHKAYFGKKDFQQLAIIRYITKQLKYPIEIVACEIVREPHGLAMSSRNLRLSDKDFYNAKIIYETLSKIPNWIKQFDIPTIKENVIRNINTVEPFKVEYIELVDSYDLQIVKNINNHKSITACIAVYCNDVRLIDNYEIIL